MNERSGHRVIAASALLLASLCVAGFAAAPSYAADSQCAAPGTKTTADTWAQQMLAPDQVWPLTRGDGQRIAVLDSGVDAAVAQLRGRVETGYDAIKSGGRANTDCLGAGTHVAGGIAAAKAESNGSGDAAGNAAMATGVYGVAPDATIVPVRVIGEPGPNMSATPIAATLARGIRWATQHDADVIDVSVWLTKDDPDVRQAVSDAVAAGIVVVAAAGDLGGGEDGNPTTYPAAYPDVIGVTAVAPGGMPWDGAERGPYVDLAAPGAGVPALARGRGAVTVEGSTAMAAGFVSGAAALVRARWPHASATEVTQRLYGSASPASAGAYGHGIVNPVQAVTAGLAAKPAVSQAALRPVTLSPEQVAAAAAARRSQARAVEWTVIGLSALLILTLLAVGIPRARRRAWRPAYAAVPKPRPEPIEPPPVAPLFEDP